MCYCDHKVPHGPSYTTALPKARREIRRFGHPWRCVPSGSRVVIDDANATALALADCATTLAKAIRPRNYNSRCHADVHC